MGSERNFILREDIICFVSFMRCRIARPSHNHNSQLSFISIFIKRQPHLVVESILDLVSKGEFHLNIMCCTKSSLLQLLTKNCELQPNHLFLYFPHF